MADASSLRIELPRSYNAAVDLIERNLAAGRAAKTAFIDDRGSITYGELAERVDHAANALRRLGIEQEQRVVLLMLDTIDFPVAFLGAIKAGIVPVPVNTLLTAADFEYVLADSRARGLIVADALYDRVARILSRLPELRHVVIAGGEGVSGRHHFTALLDAAEPTAKPANTTCDDAGFWFYSSGSTGAPKGTVHAQSHLILTAEHYAKPVLGIAESDIVYSAAKLFFAYGLGNALTFPMAVGATSILLAERPTPAVVARILKEKRPTIFYGVPTLFAQMLASPDLPAKSEVALRRCVSAGEALPEDIGKRWTDRFGVEILDGLGSTEMLHIFLSNRPGQVRYGATGLPVPGYEIKLLDDDGNAVPAGEIGELFVAGPTSAAMYWNNCDRSRGTFQGRWTKSGDKYVCDAEGYYTYCGRADDMMKVGGIWVSPFEVEAALMTHDAVLEAAVVGHDDENRLLKPRAFIVLRPGVASSDTLAVDLQNHVKAKLAPYKYPRWIEFSEELPKTATGKIQRFKLRG